MFVPVACSQCGKPFQVPEAAVGRAVACPWCAASVLGLPVAAAAPHPEPLSLDDPAPRARWPVTAAVVTAVVVGVAGLTLLVLRFSKLVEADWATFTAPDGSCSALMPAAPTAERTDPIPHSPVIGAGERFVAARRAAKATVSLGWSALDAERAKGVRPEDLIDAVVRHRRDALRATAASRPAPYRMNDFQGAEVTYESAAGTRVELILVVPTGPRPRVYVLAIEGVGVKADDPVTRRFFNSFRLN